MTDPFENIDEVLDMTNEEIEQAYLDLVRPQLMVDNWVFIKK
jgi:hypothetical protein